MRTLDQELSDNMSKAKIRITRAGQCAEGQQVQGGECFQSGREELEREMKCWHIKRRIECAGDQVSAGDGRKPQISYVNRPMCGSDGVPDVRHEGVAQMRGQLTEQFGKLSPDGSCRSSLFGGDAVDHATTVSAEI